MPSKTPLPRHHEPRAAHAAQRHHRLLRDDRAGRRADARCRAAQGICAADQRFRPASAVGRQRHPRHVEDGIRQFRDFAGAVRAARGAAQLLQPAGAEGARKRHRSRHPRAGGSARHDRRSARVQADRAQPRLQRHQVHRARRHGHGLGRGRGIAADAARHRHRRRHRAPTISSGSAIRSSRPARPISAATKAPASGCRSSKAWSACMAAR